MAELDTDAIRRETAERLVDLAISNHNNDDPAARVSQLVEAAASDAELLMLAAATARELAESSKHSSIIRAVETLDAARRHVEARG